MHRTGSSTPHRVAIVAAVVAVLGAACGDPGAVDAGKAPPSTATTPEVRVALPMEVSGPGYTDVVAVGDTGQFVFVDGYSGESSQKGADVWLVSGEEARLLARFDEALLYPSGWLGDDGAVRLLGIPCEEFDQEDEPHCLDVPVHQLIIAGETVERRELDLRVSSSTGFSAAGTGDGAVLTVGRSVIEDGAEPRFEETAYQLDADGELTELGVAGDAGPICSIADRVVMFPTDVSAAAGSAAVIQEVRDGELVAVATVEPLAEPTAVVLGCDESGEALVGTMGAGVQYRTLAADGTWSNPTPGVSGPATFEDRQLMRWDRVEGSSSGTDMNSDFVLSALRDGAWVEQGKVRSLEDPQDTSISGDVAVTLIYQHPRLVLDLVR